MSISHGMIYKGFEAILWSAEKLCKKNIPFEWTIIGVNRNDKIIRLFESFTAVNVDNLPLNFLGQLTSKEIVLKMQSSDIFVHLSHIENSSNSISEAMLLGMPVIASNTGGTPSLIQDSETGFLIYEGDIDAVVDRILSLRHNFSLIKMISENSKKCSQARHDREKILLQLISIYNRVLNKEKIK
jgi:glycosyltransferase involved in cell wall biosynthesis